MVACAQRRAAHDRSRARTAVPPSRCSAARRTHCDEADHRLRHAPIALAPISAPPATPLAIKQYANMRGHCTNGGAHVQQTTRRYARMHSDRGGLRRFPQAARSAQRTSADETRASELLRYRNDTNSASESRMHSRCKRKCVCARSELIACAALCIEVEREPWIFDRCSRDRILVHRYSYCHHA
jgi:hypothetical protein